MYLIPEIHFRIGSHVLYAENGIAFDAVTRVNF